MSALGAVLFFSFVGLILALAVTEVRRYRATRLDVDGIAYSRRRLARRLGVAALILAALAGTFWRPASLGPWMSLAWYGCCLAAILLVVILALRDLHETSVQVVRENKRFKQNLAEEMERAAKETPGRAKRRRD